MVKRFPKKAQLRHYFWRWFDTLPFALPAALAAFGTVAIALLLLHQFRPVLVWPIGILAALVMWFAVLTLVPPIKEDHRRNRRWCDLVVIIAVVMWGIANSLYAGQHLFTNRDPASYAITGIWLSEHPSAKIDKQPVLPEVEELATHSGGFTATESEPDHLHARGPHLFPALLGLAASVGGEKLLFHLNPLIGALAILAVYGFARLFMRARWAVFAAVALAVTLPMIYFSRDTYTEPLTIIFLFGSLSLIWLAQKAQRPALWGVAGVTASASTLVRIDSFLVVAALLLFAGVFLALSKPPERRIHTRNIGYFVAGIALIALLGWLNFSLLTGSYFEDHVSLFMKQIYLIGAVIIASGLLVLISWKTRAFTTLERWSRPWRKPAIIIVLLIVALLLASRPLWHTSYTTVQNGLIAGLQMAAGVLVEPRNYAEQTVNWVLWYCGIIIGITALGGMCHAVARLVSSRPSIVLLAPLCAILIPTIVYLLQPSIVADQIWAARRFLPVTIPGLIFFSAFLFYWLEKRYFSRSVMKEALLVFLAIVAIALPLWTSLPFLTLRPYVPQLARIDDTCKALPHNAVVVWLGTARSEAIQPTRLFCDVPTAGYGKLFSNKDAPTRQTLKAIAAAAREKGQEPIIGLYKKDIALLKNSPSAKVTTVHTSTTEDIEQTLITPPQSISHTETSVVLGRILPNGRIAPVE